MKFEKEFGMKKGAGRPPFSLVRALLAPAITIIIRFPTTLKVTEATGEFLPGALWS